MFSSDILLLEFPFPLEFFVLHSTNREVDEAERKLTVIKAGQSDMQTSWGVTGSERPCATKPGKRQFCFFPLHFFPSALQKKWCMSAVNQTCSLTKSFCPDMTLAFTGLRKLVTVAGNNVLTVVSACIRAYYVKACRQLFCLQSICYKHRYDCLFVPLQLKVKTMCIKVGLLVFQALHLPPLSQMIWVVGGLGQ